MTDTTGCRILGDTTNIGPDELLARLSAERFEVEQEILVHRRVQAEAQTEIDRLEQRLSEIDHGVGLLR